MSMVIIVMGSSLLVLLSHRQPSTAEQVKSIFVIHSRFEVCGVWRLYMYGTYAWSSGIYTKLCISFYSDKAPCRHRGRAVKANDSKSFDVSRVGSSPAGVVFVWLAWLDIVGHAHDDVLRLRMCFATPWIENSYPQSTNINQMIL